MSIESYRIYCDETWKEHSREIASPYYVFHGVLLKETVYEELLDCIESFRDEFGFVEELKWVKVPREFKNSIQRQSMSRYEEYLERVFFNHLAFKNISLELRI